LGTLWILINSILLTQKPENGHPVLYRSNNAFFRRIKMKKSLIIFLVLIAGITQIKGAVVDLVNWSSKYKIAVTDKNGKWIQIAPLTRTRADVGMRGFDLRACDGKSQTCGFSSTGDFTWNGKQSTSYLPANFLSDGKTVFVFDAGNSFFSGLATTTPSTSKTVKVLALSNNDPLIVKITDKARFVEPVIQSIPTTPAQRPTNNITEEQLKADPIQLTAQQITTLTIQQRFTLFGIDPKFAVGYPGDNAPGQTLSAWAHQLQPKIAALAAPIKTRYRKLSMKYHPDKGGSKEATQVINTTFNLFDAHGPYFE
jgi:hypothetical protein